ncbi:MAG: PTS sugar transporter subunit IIA [Spirochaetota bacterium]
MSLWHSLYRECILTQSEITHKEELLHKAAELASNTQPLDSLSEQEIFAKLSRRESIGSTGLTDGIAVPHCSFDGINEFVVGVITTARPIDFGALDEKPSQIFIFLVGPTEKRNTHIRLLASISKAVKEEAFRSQLLEAQSADTIIELFSTYVSFPEQETTGLGKSQLTIFVQREELFEDVLEAVSSETEGSVAVIETENANQYLYHMPLFAAFWNERHRNFSRVIIAVVDRDGVNKVLRRVNSVAPDLEHTRGIMITVQDLSFALGSLDF